MPMASQRGPSDFSDVNKKILRKIIPGYLGRPNLIVGALARERLTVLGPSRR